MSILSRVHKFSERGYRLTLLSCTVTIFLAFFVSACTAEKAPPAQTVLGSCTLGIAQDASNEETIQRVIQSEGEFVVKQQIDSLMALWAEDSTVVDAQHTTDSDSDDQVWRGKDAIRHRYVRVVFPGAPTSITPSDLEIQLNGENATVISSTKIDSELAKAGDRWQLVKQNNCWLLQNLTYNLEAAQK